MQLSPSQASLVTGDDDDPRRSYVETRGPFTVCMQEVVHESGVLGQGRPTDKVGAVKIGASLQTPQTYANETDNVRAAIKNRIEDKHIPYTPTGEDTWRIKKFIDACMDDTKGIFTRKRIKEWAAQHPILEELRSSKWSTDRVSKAIERAFTEAKVEVNFGIKLEALPEKGKAPRLLIADGDVGQLLSLATIHCFEWILFEHYESHCVKHGDSRAKMRDIAARMRGTCSHEQDVCEGDGTAWDTCCSLDVRAQLENRILWKITAVLVEVTALPKEWFIEQMKPNELKKLKARSRKCDPATGHIATTVMHTINAIRRSGHRGTSCLNWWVNHALWAISFMDEPWKVINARQRRFKCRWGKKDVFYDYVFEGDDSYTTSQNLKIHVGELEAFWKRMGFNMKFLWVEPKAETGGIGVSTVIGFNIAVDKYGPLPDEIIPEPKRGLISSAWSVSTVLRTTVDTGCPDYHALAAASHTARAAGMAGCFPELYYLYIAQARYHTRQHRIKRMPWTGENAALDREAKMKIWGTDNASESGYFVDQGLQHAADLHAKRPRADKLIHALGLDVTALEAAAFTALDELGPDNDDILRGVIPASWGW